MAEVPAEAPAEGEAVAEVKIDSKLSSLRLTFSQENPLPTPCMDLTEFPPKVYPLHKDLQLIFFSLRSVI